MESSEGSTFHSPQKLKENLKVVESRNIFCLYFIFMPCLGGLLTSALRICFFGLFRHKLLFEKKTNFIIIGKILFIPEGRLQNRTENTVIITTCTF